MTRQRANSIFISSSRRADTTQSRIEQAERRTRKVSTQFVDPHDRQPGVFQGQALKGDTSILQRLADFLIQRVGRENIMSAVVHWTKSPPHLHLPFVPLTRDNHLCAKDILGNRANLTKWQDDFTPIWWRNTPTWRVDKAPSRQVASISPPGFSSRIPDRQHDQHGQERVQEESANTSKRVKFDKKINAKKGRAPNIVYGYDKTIWDYFNLAINEEEAAVIRQIYHGKLKTGMGQQKSPSFSMRVPNATAS